MNQLFISDGQSIGASASASVLPMNIQDWSPLGWTGLISLQSKDSQESSPTPQFKSINSSVLSFLYSPSLTSIHDYWKKFCVRSIIYCLKYPLPPTSMGRTCSVNPQCWTWSCSLLGIVTGQCTPFCPFTMRLEGYGPKPMDAGSYQKLEKARDGFFCRAPGGSPDDTLSL